MKTTTRTLIMIIIMIFAVLTCYAQQTEDYQLYPENIEEETLFSHIIVSSENFVFIVQINPDNYYMGSINVYTNNQNNLSFHQELIANDANNQNSFGISIFYDEENEKLYVGASNSDDKGAVYVFALANDGLFYQEAKVIADNGLSGDGFGYNVHQTGNLLLVQARCKDYLDYNFPGIIYVLDINDNYSKIAEIHSNNMTYYGGFGLAISSYQNFILFGNCNANNRSGIIEVWQKEGNDLTFHSIIQANDPMDNAKFGLKFNIDLESGEIVTTAVEDNLYGAIYIGNLNNGSYLEEQKITVTDLNRNSIKNAEFYNGKIYASSLDEEIAIIEKNNANTWTKTSSLIPTEFNNNYFGQNFSFLNNKVIATCAYQTVNGLIHAGAAYVYTLNTPPEVNPIANFSFDEDESYNLNLNEYFSDNDELTFTVSGNTNIEITILNGIATLTPLPNWNGAETITFTGTDLQGEFVTVNVVVTINSVNDTPTIELPTSLNFSENGNLTVDFNDYASDVDEDELNFEVNGNTHIHYDGTTFTVDLNWNGSETITVIVNDGELTASDTMIINISSVDNPTTLTTPIENVITEEDFIDPIIIDLDDHFNDVDSDIVYSVETISELFSLQLEDNVLTITSIPDSFGISLVTVNANNVQTQFELNILSVNDTPTIELPTSLNFPENGNLIVDFNDYASDVDEDELNFEVNGNTHIHYDGTTFTVDLNWNGSETITVIVNDGELTASDTMIINISSVDNPTTLTTPIENVITEEDFIDPIIIDLDDHFNDVDSDIVYSVETISELFSLQLEDNVLTITSIPDSFGISLVTVNANNVQTQFELTVVPVNDEPTILNFLPTENNFEITEIGESSFSITAEDIDSEINYSWFVNSENQNIPANSFVYNFTENGDYQIKTIIFDEEFELEQIWSVTVNLTGIGEYSIIPTATKLVGNYPNPFNPTTTIQYDLSENGFVEISIFNLKGQLVKSLINQNKNAGQHTIKWNGTDDNRNKVGSGLYFYKLNINGKIHTMKRCVMLK